MSGVPASTKHSIAICKFIKGKEIEFAISLLERVSEKKLAIPMKGEIPHRKGREMMAGRYPQKAAKVFIKILKSLLANAHVNGLEDPVIITLASATGSTRHLRRFGRTKFKRSHIYIVAREKNAKLNKTDKNKR